MLADQVDTTIEPLTPVVSTSESVQPLDESTSMPVSPSTGDQTHISAVASNTPTITDTTQPNTSQTPQDTIASLPTP